MFFLGTRNIFVPGDSVFMLFMLFKCMCNNISIEKKTKTSPLNRKIFVAKKGKFVASVYRKPIFSGVFHNCKSFISTNQKRVFSHITS